MSEKDKTIKDQIDGVLDETTQAIMDEINQKMQAVEKSSDKAAADNDSIPDAFEKHDVQDISIPSEEQAQEAAEEIMKEASLDNTEAVFEEATEPLSEEMSSTEENTDEEQQDEANDEVIEDEYEEPYEQEIEEEYMTRKERKEAKKLAKEAAKKAELEAKIEAEAAKRNDPNRASAGLRGFGIFTIFMFIITTALGAFLVWYLILSPAYIKNNSQREFDYPEISSASDASAWEELTPLGYESDATPTDADIATSSDASEEPSDIAPEAAE